MTKDQRGNLFLVEARLFAGALKKEKQDQAEAHFWNAAELAWNPDQYYWNEWSALMVKEFCDPENVILAIKGAKQSGKSTTIMAIGMVLFYGAWKKCSVIYRTTTLDDAQKRGWGEFQRLHSQAIDNVGLRGHYVRSKPPKVTCGKNTTDLKNVIICIPVKEGTADSTKTQLAGIKGYHTEFQLVIDDELNELPDGTEDAPAALNAPWKVFKYAGIGNPNDWRNPLGKIAKPVKKLPPKPGNTRPEYEDLPTDFLYEELPITWPIRDGTCIRLDARNSPNILRGRNENGDWPYPHLPTPDSYEQQLSACGGDHNHVHMWQFVYALPPPDGTQATILSIAMVRQYGADTRPEWRNTPINVAGLDPAFSPTGDDCILLFARHGLTIGNLWIIEVLDAVKIPILAHQKKDSFYIVAKAAIKACKERKVEPYNFAFDCSGTGLGVRSILREHWSTEVHDVDSTGAPSNRIISANDTRLAKDYYDRRSSEVAFSIRHYIQARQMAGLDGSNTIVKEGSDRVYRSVRGKIEVISKDQTPAYKRSRVQRSSNYFDALGTICDMLATQGYLPGTKHTAARTLVEQMRDRLIEGSLISAPLPQAPAVKTSPDAMAALYAALGSSARQTIPPGFSGSMGTNDIGIGGF